MLKRLDFEKTSPGNARIEQGQFAKEILELPGNSGVNLYAMGIIVAATAGLVFSFYKILFDRELLLLFPGIGSAIGIFLIGRAVIKRMPSKLEITDGMVCIFDVPLFWIEVDRFYFPILCKKCICISRDRLVLEWLNYKLVWNDMEGGRSVFIVAEEDSRPVIRWLLDHGFSVPTIPH